MSILLPVAVKLVRLIAGFQPNVAKISNNPFVICKRWHKNWLQPYYRELYKRRLEVGPEPERPRSIWLNWNYDAEIYAFGKRLGEDFNDTTIRQAFTHRSYIEKEIEKRSRLGMDTDIPIISSMHNEELVRTGSLFMEEYIKRYLQTVYPKFPEEGINHVTLYLTSVDTLAFLAQNFGMKDLILSAEFPLESSTLSTTFTAVIGAVLKDQGDSQAQLFVRDLVIPQLIGRDINELWPIVNPMGMLVDILSSIGEAEPEPRLTRHAGINTVMSVYFVGLYSDKKLIGEGCGETTTIAEEMAARDALKRLFGTELSAIPLPFTNNKNSPESLPNDIELEN